MILDFVKIEVINEPLGSVLWQFVVSLTHWSVDSNRITTRTSTNNFTLAFSPSPLNVVIFTVVLFGSLFNRKKFSIDESAVQHNREFQKIKSVTHVISNQSNHVSKPVFFDCGMVEWITGPSLHHGPVAEVTFSPHSRMWRKPINNCIIIWNKTKTELWYLVPVFSNLVKLLEWCISFGLHLQTRKFDRVQPVGKWMGGGKEEELWTKFHHVTHTGMQSV